MTDLPGNVQTCGVKGHFAFARLSPGDADGVMNLVPVVGLVVTLTPSPTYLLDATATPPTVIVPEPLVLTTDSNGDLRDVDGNSTAYVIASDDPDLNPHDWTYTVSFAGTSASKFAAYSAAFPAGETIDLSLITPIPSALGVSVSVAQAAEAAAAAYASAAAASAAAAATLLVPDEVTPQLLTTTVSGYLVPGVDPGTKRFPTSVEDALATNVVAPAVADKVSFIDLGSDATANRAKILAAASAMTVSGRLHGTLILRGKGAPIASTVTLDLGYPNITSTLASYPERFALRVEGSLTFAAGIGVGLLIKSGLGATVDVTVQGGGSSGDIAVQVEDHVALELSVQGKDFAGTLLKADANGDTTKRVRMSRVRRVSATTCGQAIYWRNIEAFGEFSHIWDSNCVNGSQFINCADTAIVHYENYSPASQTIGLDFDNCNTFQVGVITLGDKAATLMRIRGGDFGTIQKVRVSGDPDLSVPAVAGLLLEDVSSVDIDNVITFRLATGLEIKGGGGTGRIRIGNHRSLTGDTVPLKISAGTSTTPNVRIQHASYRNCRDTVQIGAGITGGRLSLAGQMRDFLTVGASGRYAIEVDSGSGALELDVAGLKEFTRGGGLTGFTNHPTPANVFGVCSADIGDPLTHGSNPTSAGMAVNTLWRNATSKTVALVVVLRNDPGVSQDSGVTWRLGPTTSPPVIGDDVIYGHSSVDLAATRIIRTLIVPPYWYVQATGTGVGVTLHTSSVYPIS